MKTARPLVLALLFVTIIGLEIGHGYFRLGAIRAEQHDRLIEGIEREFGELAHELRSRLSGAYEHALYLARSPAVRRLAMAGSSGAGREATSRARRELEAQILPYLIAFRAIDRVRLFDPGGHELFRCERIGQGVGSLPESRLDPGVDAAALAWSEKLRGGAEVALSGLEVDNDRVEVSESRRQVLHFRTAVALEGRHLGVLTLTVYAAPILDSVREFVPLDGVCSQLVGLDGDYLACSARARERGRVGAGSLGRDFPGLAAAAIGRVPSRTGTLRGCVETAVVHDEPRWFLVTEIPDSALDAASGPLRGEYARIIATTVAITLALAVAGVLLVRMSVREVRLREAARQKELERQLEISERLGSLGLLTAGVAHEINNPLEGIGNYMALLDRALGSGDSPEAQRYLEMIRHGFDRIRDIVRDLSSFARPAIHEGLADLRAVLDRALRMLRYTREFKEVEVQRSGLEAPLEIPGDPGRLEQVFINLLHNSGRATGGRGKVSIRARRSAGRGAGAAAVELVVEDDGPGIPEAELGRIFDPFFTSSEGTGLGLSISYGIVRAHGGTLRAENRAEGGARFVLRLPAVAGMKLDDEHAGARAAREEGH